MQIEKHTFAINNQSTYSLAKQSCLLLGLGLGCLQSVLLLLLQQQCYAHSDHHCVAEVADRATKRFCAVTTLCSSEGVID